MLLAELEIRHSRPVAPTRRVALGHTLLPTDPPPGFGGLLLAGIVAAHVRALDEELLDDLELLLDDLALGYRVPQPRLRHRFQTDVVGLGRSRHRLVGVGQAVALELDEPRAPLPQILGAVYAAARLPVASQPDVFRLLRRAARWDGDADSELIHYLMSDEAVRFRRRMPGDERWARVILGFDIDHDPGPGEVLRRFRSLVREAHPDHGADVEGAGERILELTEAKRALLAR